jgi:hypothetical protein
MRRHRLPQLLRASLQASIAAAAATSAAGCMTTEQTYDDPNYNAFGGQDLQGYGPIPCFEGSVSTGDAGAGGSPERLSSYLLDLDPLASALSVNAAVLETPGAPVAARNAGQLPQIDGWSSGAAVACLGAPLPMDAGLSHAECNYPGSAGVPVCGGLDCTALDGSASYALLTCDAKGWHALATLQDLAKALGPIDSAAKAWVWVWAQGYDIECEHPPYGSDASPVGLGNVRPAAGGFQVLAFQDANDGTTRIRFEITVSADGTMNAGRTERYHTAHYCSGGRRTAGTRADRPGRASSAVGELFAQMAFLEAASVPAFARLRAELAALGAPVALLRAAAAARRDEIRHARVTARLARRFGGAPRAPMVEPVAARSIEDIAVENAAEGCVRETFGAAVTEWQARTAGDPGVRRAMRHIARDEARHAALAWRTHAWLDATLSASARHRVADARGQAVEALRVEIAVAAPRDHVRIAGMPTAAQASAMVDALRRGLWLE